MTNPGSLTMGFAGVDPRQLAPSVGTAQVGNAISAASLSPALIDSAAPARSNPFESLGFTAHLPALKPVFSGLHSGVNLIFGVYQIYINHWGTLRLIDGTRAPTATPAATTIADAARTDDLPGGCSYAPNLRLNATHDRSSEAPAWRSTIARISKETARAPSQVFMAEVGTSTSGNNGRADDLGTRQETPTTNRAAGPGITGQMIVQLGEPRTIPKKVPVEQGPSNQKSSQQPSNKQQAPGQGSQPSRSRQQTPVAAAGEPPKEKIYMSKESMAMVKEAVARGWLLPSDATRNELRAYNKRR